MFLRTPPCYSAQIKDTVNELFVLLIENHEKIIEVIERKKKKKKIPPLPVLV